MTKGLPEMPAPANIPESALPRWTALLPAFFWLALVAIGPARVLPMKPFISDNLIPFSVGMDDPAAILSEGRPIYLPTYRPVTYLLNWLEFQVHGYELVPYLLLTLLLWFGAGAGLFLILRRLTGSIVAPTLATGLFLVDNRANEIFLLVLERQTLLALLFGIAGLFCAWRGIETKLRPRHYIGFAISLILAGFSKEFGLAFAVFLPAFVLIHRPAYFRVFALISVACVAAILGVRAMILNASTTEAILASAHPVWSASTNIAKSIVATFLPNLFDTGGMLLRPISARNSLEDYWLQPALQGALIGLIALAAWKRTRAAIPFAILILVVCVLNFGEMRHRNLVLGVFGLYVIAGLGLHEVQRFIERSGEVRFIPAKSLRAIGVASAIALTLAQGIKCRKRIAHFVENFAAVDPEASRGKYGIRPEVIDTVKSFHY